ncbi:MAG TPA: dual specificity protein phosphatase [Anaerolineales bacterium]|nr:dual specificity protein phosphatase [Anaerolineales bacterium]
MDQIRPWLFIGNLWDTQQLSYLQEYNINAMLQLEEEVKQPGIESYYLPVADFAPLKFEHIRQGISFIKEHKQLGNRILVACAHGINRSSAFCIAALVEDERLGILESFKEVNSKHPSAMPIELVWDSICAYYNETVPYVEVLRTF